MTVGPHSPGDFGPCHAYPCVLSFDSQEVDISTGKVTYTYSSRNVDTGAIIEQFQTGFTFSLTGKPLSAAEHFMLLCCGLCHSNYPYCALAPKVQRLEIRAGYFSPEHIAFFTEAFEGALGEFHYIAGMNGKLPEMVCLVPAPSSTSTQPASSSHLLQADTDPSSSSSHEEQEHKRERLPQEPHSRSPPRVIVPFGGGKDSTVLAELLAAMGCEVKWAYMSESAESWDCFTKFQELAAKSVSPEVLQAAQDFPCWERLVELWPGMSAHDYTACCTLIACVGAFFALHYGYDYVCVGNENSANEINLVHPTYGYPINHQWEKAFPAEMSFNAFFRSVAPHLWYFSGLQHMSELEIARRFVDTCKDKFLHLIISCNATRNNDWCGACDKCAFVNVIFQAYLPPKEVLTTIFGKSAPSDSSSDCCSHGQSHSHSHQDHDQHMHKHGQNHSSGGGNHGVKSHTISGQIVDGLGGHLDMYDSPKHILLLEKLMGLVGHKPFDCVGTVDEVLAAMYGAYLNHYQPSGKLPLLYQKHKDLILSRGKVEWDKISAEIEAADKGEWPKPNLYPPWYRLSKH